MFRWCSWPRWGIKGSGENQNPALQEHLLESPGPHCLYTLSRGHYWTCVWWIYSSLVLGRPPWSIGFTNELSEESDQFRFLRPSCFTNLKGAVGLIMSKTSDIRISIPLDLSSRTSIPLPRFIRSRRPTSKWHLSFPFLRLFCLLWMNKAKVKQKTSTYECRCDERLVRLFSAEYDKTKVRG